MNCYVKDYGASKVAYCEQQLPNGFVLTVSEHVKEEPKPELWARLGALITKTSEVVEAQ